MLSAEPVFAVDFESENAGSVTVAPRRENARDARTPEPGPSLVGSPFIGAATSVEGRVAGMTVSVIVGTSVGEVVGTIVIDGRRGREGHRYHFKGAVNARGLFVWHGSTEEGRRAVFTGTVGPGGNTLSGKYMSQAPGTALEAGNFLASRR
jgi:hypothetical protein